MKNPPPSGPASSASQQDREDFNLFRQSGWNEIGGADQFPTPLSELVRVEERDLREYKTMREDEIRKLRIETISLFLRSVIGDPDRSPDIISTGLNCFAAGWDLALPPFDKMTQEDIGELAAQGRAAICERHKKLTNKKRQKTGSRKSNREKSGSLRAKLSQKAKGNHSRADATALAVFREGYKANPNKQTDN